MSAFDHRTVRGLPLPSDLQTVEAAGTTLAYRETGTGEPVVFVHGSLSDLTIWDPQLPVVGADHRAIAYSRRFAWPNADLPAGSKDTMDVHVSDLLAFLRAVDAYPAHLVGNSFGAFTCLVAAIREPAAVRSLVLEEPPLIPLVTGDPPAPARILRSLVTRPRIALPVVRFAASTLAPAQRLVEHGAADAGVDRFARGVLGARRFALLPEDVRRHMRANTSTQVGQFLAAGGFAPITEAEIRGVRVPALVVTGAESPDVFRRLAALLVTLLPLGERREVPDASHLMHLQNPSAFNPGLLEFLSRRHG